MKKQLEKRIQLLDGLRAHMQTKYGPSDALVLDLVQDIKSLQSKGAEQKRRVSARLDTAAGRQ